MMTNFPQPDLAGPHLLTGGVLILLRAEGLLVFVLCTAIYFHMGGDGLVYLALFLIPDLAMAGYALGPKPGAAIYNMIHTYVSPVVLAGIGFYFAPDLLPFALIWAAHIGMDRVCAYGLKYPEAFSSTHLNQIER